MAANASDALRPARRDFTLTRLLSRAARRGVPRLRRARPHAPLVGAARLHHAVLRTRPARGRPVAHDHPLRRYRHRADRGRGLSRDPRARAPGLHPCLGAGQRHAHAHHPGDGHVHRARRQHGSPLPAGGLRHRRRLPVARGGLGRLARPARRLYRGPHDRAASRDPARPQPQLCPLGRPGRRALVRAASCGGFHEHQSRRHRARPRRLPGADRPRVAGEEHPRARCEDPACSATSPSSRRAPPIRKADGTQGAGWYTDDWQLQPEGWRCVSAHVSRS